MPAPVSPPLRNTASASARVTAGRGEGQTGPTHLHTTLPRLTPFQVPGYLTVAV